MLPFLGGGPIFAIPIRFPRGTDSVMPVLEKNDGRAFGV